MGSVPRLQPLPPIPPKFLAFSDRNILGQFRSGTCARFARAGLESRSHIKAIPGAKWHLGWIAARQIDSVARSLSGELFFMWRRDPCPARAKRASAFGCGAAASVFPVRFFSVAKFLGVMDIKLTPTGNWERGTRFRAPVLLPEAASGKGLRTTPADPSTTRVFPAPRCARLSERRSGARF